MSERAMSIVCAGRPYIRSRFTLSKLASAASTPRRASAAEWMRPSAASIASSKLCTPSEMRFTPASRKPRTDAGEERVDRPRREQARRAAADEYADQPPAPHGRQQAFQVGEELGD